MLAITALYAGLLALLFLMLSARVIVYRRGNRLSLGDHGDPVLERRIRAQANCAEYTPIGLILLGLTESMGTPAAIVHLLGLALLVGRTFHGVAFSRAQMDMRLRVGGMVLTLSMILLSAVGLIAHAIF